MMSCVSTQRCAINMDGMIGIYKKNRNESLTSWILNTRRYVHPYETRKYYSNLFGDIKKEDNTLLLLPKLNKDSRFYYHQLAYIYTNYDCDNSIKDILDNELTKSFGVVLAIERKLLSEYINYFTDEEILLYLENNDMTDNDFNSLFGVNFVDKLSRRIIDAKKVMYTRLVDNLYIYIKKCQTLPKEIDENFVKGYIEHVSIYNDDIFLRYLLSNYDNIHPSFNKIYDLQWDPFKKSRVFPDWLKAIDILDFLVGFYPQLKVDNERIQENQYFLNKYMNYMNLIHFNIH